MHAVVAVASFPGHPNFIFQSGILSSEKLKMGKAWERG